MKSLVLSELVTRTATYPELATLTGCTAQTVALWIKALRLKRLVHVTSWDGDARGAASIPRFAWGPGRDDAKRPCITPAVLQKQRRQRNKLKVEI